MVVIVLENAVESLRGELTRWLIELKPGVFVGTVSALVREKLWKRVADSNRQEGALLIWDADTEQGFGIAITGEPTRSVVDVDGVQLIKVR